MSTFNNREIVTAFWILLFFIFALTKKEVRNSIFKVFEALFDKKILLLFFIMFLYTIFMLFILSQFKIWKVSLIKETIIWYILSGSVLLVRYGSTNNKTFSIRTAIFDNLKIVLFIEFIVNLYTFPIYIEFFFVPLMIIVVMMEAYSSTDKKYNIVGKFMSNFQVFIGILIVAFVIISIFKDYQNLLKIDTIRSVILPPWLTILFIPFLYLFIIFLKYELVFVRINIGKPENEFIKRKAKIEILKFCKLNISNLEIALNMQNYNLMNINDETDIQTMKNIYKKIKKSPNKAI